jgi:uncharacterized protein DUF1877
MGMYLSLAAVSDATIERLLADPPLVWQIMEPDDPNAVAAAREPPPGPGFFGRLLGRKAPPPPPEPPPLDLQPGEGDLGPDGDLEKSWQGIHYLLTGTAWEGDPPLNFLLAGGRELDIEIGLGPPRTHTAAETRIIAAAFAGIDDAELRRRFAPAEMTRLEIYPGVWDLDPAKDDTLGHLLDGVAVLRSGLARVVGQGHGLLIVHT